MITLALSTYNRLSYLKECLHSFSNLAPLPDEIVIVNDGSTDGTREYLNQLVKTNPLVRVAHHENNAGLSAGRNTAIQQARGDLIAFTDDDCRVDPQWLTELIKPFGDPGVVLSLIHI